MFEKLSPKSRVKIIYATKSIYITIKNIKKSVLEVFTQYLPKVCFK